MILYKTLRFVFFVLCFVFLIYFSSAYEIGIAPEKLKFEGKIGEELCKKIFLFSDESFDYFNGKDFWIEGSSKSKKVSDYFKSGEEVGLELIYERKIQLSLHLHQGTHPHGDCHDRDRHRHLGHALWPDGRIGCEGIRCKNPRHGFG